MTNALGTLYLISTPIGNLDDMTHRAIQTLKQVDEIYCEDTRRSSILLRHFEIDPKSKPLSFHDHSNRQVLANFSRSIKEGKSIAYITDAGTPVVSDPGFILVRECINMGANIVAIPGVSAATMLFSVSGLESPKYFFHGFFPQTKGEIEKVLNLIKSVSVVHIFYESAVRLKATLKLFFKNIPNAEIVVGRELTKKFEEIVRGDAAKILRHFDNEHPIRGECVFAVLEKSKNQESLTKDSDEFKKEAQVVELTKEQIDEITKLVRSGVSSKDVSKEFSKKYDIPRRIIYDFIIKKLT